MKSFAFAAAVSATQDGYDKWNKEGQLMALRTPDITIETDQDDKFLNENRAGFYTWTAMYSKSYATKEEFEFRKKIFENNAEHLEAYNSFASPDEVAPVVLELNQFADLTDQEYSAMLGYKKNTTQP